MKRRIHDIYDIIMKLIIIIYGTIFLKFIGIDEVIKEILNTEFISHTGSKYYPDFLCRLKNGKLCHIEFQFPKARPVDLDRFFKYNIGAEAFYDTTTETSIVNFTSAKKILKRVIDESKTFHPKHIFLGEIDFDDYWQKINIKSEHNIKLTAFEEIALLVMCLLPDCKNKADILGNIAKLLKNKSLFEKRRYEYIEAIIKLEINNLISKKERKKIMEENKMSPQAETLIVNTIREVNRKTLHEAEEKGIEKGEEKGREKALEEVARNLKNNMDDEEISKLTGLSLKKIKELK